MMFIVLLIKSSLPTQVWLPEVLIGCTVECLYLKAPPARVWDVQVMLTTTACLLVTQQHLVQHYQLHYAAQVFHTLLQAGDAALSRKRPHQAISTPCCQSDADLEESIAAIQQSLLVVRYTLSRVCPLCTYIALTTTMTACRLIMQSCQTPYNPSILCQCSLSSTCLPLRRYI